MEHNFDTGETIQEPHINEKWHWKMDYCKSKNLSPALTWLWEEADRKYEEQLKEKGEEFWHKHNERKAWFDSRTPKELEEIEQWMKERHKVKDLERQLEESRKENEELLIKLKVHKNKALSVKENIKFRELKEQGK